MSSIDINSLSKTELKQMLRAMGMSLDRKNRSKAYYYNLYDTASKAKNKVTRDNTSFAFKEGQMTRRKRNRGKAQEKDQSSIRGQSINPVIEELEEESQEEAQDSSDEEKSDRKRLDFSDTEVIPIPTEILRVTPEEEDLDGQQTYLSPQMKRMDNNNAYYHFQEVNLNHLTRFQPNITRINTSTNPTSIEERTEHEDSLTPHNLILTTIHSNEEEPRRDAVKIKFKPREELALPQEIIIKNEFKCNEGLNRIEPPRTRELKVDLKEVEFKKPYSSNLIITTEYSHNEPAHEQHYQPEMIHYSIKMTQQKVVNEPPYQQTEESMNDACRPITQVIEEKDFEMKSIPTSVLTYEEDAKGGHVNQSNTLHNRPKTTHLPSRNELNLISLDDSNYLKEHLHIDLVREEDFNEDQHITSHQNDEETILVSQPVLSYQQTNPQERSNVKEECEADLNEIKYEESREFNNKPTQIHEDVDMRDNTFREVQGEFQGLNQNESEVANQKGNEYEYNRLSTAKEIFEDNDNEIKSHPHSSQNKRANEGGDMDGRGMSSVNEINRTESFINMTQTHRHSQNTGNIIEDHPIIQLQPQNQMTNPNDESIPFSFTQRQVYQPQSKGQEHPSTTINMCKTNNLNSSIRNVTITHSSSNKEDYPKQDSVSNRKQSNFGLLNNSFTLQLIFILLLIVIILKLAYYQDNKYISAGFLIALVLFYIYWEYLDRSRYQKIALNDYRIIKEEVHRLKISNSERNEGIIIDDFISASCRRNRMTIMQYKKLILPKLRELIAKDAFIYEVQTNVRGVSRTLWKEI